jgi:hypothetical protein
MTAMLAVCGASITRSSLVQRLYATPRHIVDKTRAAPVPTPPR